MLLDLMKSLNLGKGIYEGKSAVPGFPDLHLSQDLECSGSRFCGSQYMCQSQIQIQLSIFGHYNFKFAGSTGCVVAGKNSVYICVNDSRCYLRHRLN